MSGLTKLGIWNDPALREPRGDGERDWDERPP